MFATSSAAVGYPPGVPVIGGSYRAGLSSSSPNGGALATREAQRQWFKFAAAQAAGAGGNRTTLHIYDVIGADPFFGGVDVTELVSAIEALDADTELTIRINSPGGAAWDGLTLANAIMRHPGPTTTHIDGLAASAASLVALAGDDVMISRYGQMMLHNARFCLFGATVEELAEAAKVGAKLNASMAAFYADRAGGTQAQWAAAMKRESWYAADEAKAAGLATEVDDSGKREEIEAATASSIAKAAAMFGRPASELDERRRHVAVARARRTRNHRSTIGVTP